MSSRVGIGGREKEKEKSLNQCINQYLIFKENHVHIYSLLLLKLA